MGNRRAPAFGRISGAGKSSLRARDADQGRGQRGRGKRLLNRGMTVGKNQNYIKRDEMALYGSRGEDPNGREKTEDHELAAKLGFELFTDGPDRLGWLLNMNSSQKEDKEAGHMVSVVGCYFMCQDGSMFKAEVEYSPYFYLQPVAGMEMEIDSWLRRKFSGIVKDVEIVEKEDLDLKNHLSGIKRKLLKLRFWNIDQLLSVRRELMQIVRMNKRLHDGTMANYNALLDGQNADDQAGSNMKTVTEGIVDLREYDVPFHVRFAIDEDVRAGHWFMVSANGGNISLSRRADLLQRAEPRICAFDIETTKLPLQFPNAEYDQVFMISYMIDKQGYLIINREVVSKDIEDFEYTPKTEFQGPFKVFNCINEEECLRCWFDHMKTVKPAVYVTYNGDYFDWPFIETRAQKYNMNMEKEIGFKCGKNGECLSRSAVHMDCLHWVNRDSYLPQGSRGLKSVTKYKLGYDPVEVDPEDMVRFASEQPQAMASYSVSDAVATYYLYMTYIHPFIFSLSTIIPMPPDEVLRKGSGTLCEMLLMVQAYEANVIAPNKHTSASEKMHTDVNGVSHLLESETYIGGKVEALESGVFRADIPCKFRCNPEGYQQLIDSIDQDLEYAINHDASWKVEDVENYDAVRNEIVSSLQNLRDMPNREEEPLIYHLDVAAMYPNIILTNRLQPSAIVNDEDCAACVFNKPGKTCLRKMEWVWRGETYAATRAEYASIKAQLQAETFPADPTDLSSSKLRTWGELKPDEKAKMLKSRLKSYCQKVYKKVLNKPQAELRTAGICQRENSFYYDTVRAFRDRRYEYKGLTKTWKGKLEEARNSSNAVKVAEASDMCVLYDSLQLAHKCILNSFYGYVMRKGARWYSMEMAGVVTHCGANIIKRANELITKLGRPLELDTDGIWCALPKSFPEDFKFVNKETRKTFKLSYPCAMLNVMVANENTNDQFETLVDANAKKYETSSEMTIEFEVDGPYLAMVLPASKEEGKLIKKRYAVFNFDGSLAELKGFELKRRGELKLIKVFQGEVFDQFLLGNDLRSCYDAVAAAANRWLDMLDTKGIDLTDQELIDHISESSVMSKGLDEYDGRKSCAITCATRLAEFLGDGRVRDKGLVCNYVISAYPIGLATSERAIPVAIFSTDPSVARTYLRKWCGGHVGSGESHEVPDVRDIVDWEYYRERLGSAIQKIITIPAAMQRVENPVPRIKHPDWLHKLIAEKNDTRKQTKIGRFVNKGPKRTSVDLVDLEDFGIPGGAKPNLHREETLDDISEEQMTVFNPKASPIGESLSPLTPAARKRNFDTWLKAKKESWRKSRIERKRQRDSQVSGDNENRYKTLKAGLEGLFAQQADSLAQHPWYIASLASTQEPGVLKIWAVINGKMYGIRLHVPRRFYINSSSQAGVGVVPGFPGELVKKLPPNGEKAEFLYEISIPEQLYQDQLSSIQAKVASTPDIKEVYEAQVPPDWHAALSLGCVASVVPQCKGKNVGEGVEIYDLSQQSVVQHGYFPDTQDLRRMLLYHSEDPANNRALLVLHVPADSLCHIWVINPARGGQKEISSSVLQKMWEDIRKEMLCDLEEQGSEDLMDTNPSYKVTYVRTKESAQKSMRKILRSIRDRARLPTVLLLSAPSVKRLVHSLPEINDFAHAAMSSVSSSDARYPALGWQTHAARVCLKQLLASKDWLQMRLDAARYAHLPFASIGDDWVIDACDALFSRHLEDSDQLLWIKDDAEPDLSCHPRDIANDHITGEQQQKIQLCWPGVYRNVCIEIRVSHLAVNGILEASTLGELEGAVLLEDQAACGHAFRALKALAQTWIEDASKRHNVCADTLLRHMYRWLCSEQSKLYNVSLMRAVQELIKKLLLNLVVELKNLGAKVIYADTSTILVATGKHGMRDALAYTDYILETLKKRALFQWLSLVPERAWYALLFQDRYNYLGLKAPLPAEVAASMSQFPGALSSGSRLLENDDIEITSEVLRHPTFDFTLAITDFLPSALSDAFTSAIGEYLWHPWKEAVREALSSHQHKENTDYEADAKTDDILEKLEEKQNKWLTQSLPSKITEKLLKATKHIAMHIGSSDSEPSHAFPKRAGSYLTAEELGSPALAFAKSVCHFFSLDFHQKDAVRLLKKQLLRMLHVKEFGPDATWKDPCASLVIPDVVCPSCQDCRELDLCRDPSLQHGDISCSLCGALRDIDALEMKLITNLQTKIESFIVQDLKCKKCGATSTDHLQRQCHFCGGQIASSQPANLASRDIAIFGQVAEVQGMQTLQEIVNAIVAPYHK